ncbi:MAG: hypothetical protein IJ064_05555 [Bacteroidaceae bacterium]|nr:hypothetical protein [Bacteroidaceae bacterium]
MTAYDGGVPFLFADYPEVGQLVEDLKSQFVGEMRSLIYSGTSAEWKESNIMQDLLAKKVMKYYDAQIDGQRERTYFQSNSDALRAFQERSENGLNLSSKLWNQSNNYVREMEYAISTAIERGTSAVTLSKQLSQYLNDFDRLKADYEETFGHAVDCADCEYRSIRLARSEINMSYRAAEQARWQQFDFITGYEIKLSGSHPKEDICDAMVGRYPKDFVFSGWHPNCLCMCLPIIMSEDDYWKMREGRPVESQQVTEMPETFKDYVRDNQTRIEKAQSRGTASYWVRDNASMIQQTLTRRTYQMSEAELVELESTAGFNRQEYMRFTTSEYNRSAMRGFDLLRFDKAFESMCDRYEVRLASKECYIVRDGRAELDYLGRTTNGNKVELVRNFAETPNGVEVYHSKMRFPEELQGRGLSKEVFRSLFREYMDMGVSRINVTANIDVGGYCWAKYGFCAERTNAIDLISECLTKGKITQIEHDEALSIINKYGKSSFPMNLLAELPYAERMLKGECWEGYLDFSDRAQVKYMKSYIGYPNKI